MKREPAKSVFEQDCIHGRDIYCFTQKPGVCKSAKKAINRRERKQGKMIQEEE